jgi:hypothetical protein
VFVYTTLFNTPIVPRILLGTKVLEFDSDEAPAAISIWSGSSGPTLLEKTPVFYLLEVRTQTGNRQAYCSCD